MDESEFVGGESQSIRTHPLMHNGPVFLLRRFCRIVKCLQRKPLLCVCALVLVAASSAIADIYLPNLFPFLDASGFSATNSTTGSLDLSGPFFQSLGTNGRSCGTCHTPSDGMGLSAIDARIRYLVSGGKDPLFAQIDGSACPNGPVNNSLVVNNGLIRIGIQLPPNAFSANPPQYTITAVQDTYGCALTTNA